MFQRYTKLNTHLVHIDVNGLIETCPNINKLYDAKALCEKPEVLNSVAVKLQNCSETLADHHALLTQFYSVTSAFMINSPKTHEL